MCVASAGLFDVDRPAAAGQLCCRTAELAAAAGQPEVDHDPAPRRFWQRHEILGGDRTGWWLPKRRRRRCLRPEASRCPVYSAARRQVRRTTSSNGIHFRFIVSVASASSRHCPNPRAIIAVSFGAVAIPTRGQLSM